MALSCANESGVGEEVDEIDDCVTCDCSGGSDYRKCDDGPVSWCAAVVSRRSGGTNVVWSDPSGCEG